MCKPKNSPASQVICKTYEICAQLSTGVACVPHRSNVWAKATQEMICKAFDSAKIAICQKDETCGLYNGPVCVKTDIGHGEKCSDPKNCVCRAKDPKSNEPGKNKKNADDDPSEKILICGQGDLCWTNEQKGTRYVFGRMPRLEKRSI